MELDLGPFMTYFETAIVTISPDQAEEYLTLIPKMTKGGRYRNFYLIDKKGRRWQWRYNSIYNGQDGHWILANTYLRRFRKRPPAAFSPAQAYLYTSLAEGFEIESYWSKIWYQIGGGIVTEEFIPVTTAEFNARIEEIKGNR